jgi:hypothetical protein
MRGLQGALLAIMNVVVLLLPLVQLWLSTHKLLNALRIKVVALICIKLGRTRRAADVPTEAEGDAQVGSRCIASKPSLVDLIPLPDVPAIIDRLKRCLQAAAPPADALLAQSTLEEVSFQRPHRFLS